MSKPADETTKAWPVFDDYIGFWGWAAKRPDAIAVAEATGGRTVSFGELAGASNQIARAFGDLGLANEQNLAVLMPNCIEMLEFVLGALQSGVYFTPINNHLSVPEIAHVVANCDASMLVVHERFREQALAAVELCGFPLERCFWVGGDHGSQSFQNIKLAQSTTAPDTRTAGSLMIYSSGTTGKPKGIRTPLPTSGPDGPQAGRALSVQRFGYKQGDGVHLANGPLYHSGPITFALCSLYYGHTVVLLDKWDAETALLMIAEHRVTNTFMVPTMFSRLLKLPEQVRRKYDCSSLSVLVHGAAPCPPPVKHEMIEWLGPILFESYGGTEGAGTTCDSAQWLTKPGTVGPPAPGVTLKVFDESGNELPAGEIGSVYVSASMGLPEYYKDPEGSAAARRGDLYTIGDIGYLDRDGWLFLVDRKSDMLISGGVNIYPAEIERALLKHPKVRDAAVFGVPSEEWGEAVKAVVELEDGFTPEAGLEEEIIAFCLAHIARYKVPRSIDFIDQLPRAENGKLYKRQLRDKYWAGHAKRI